MTVNSARAIPVIAAVGEYIDRPKRLDEAREPVDLMVEALKACEADAGVRLLDRVGLLSLIGLVSWPYKDPVALLAQKLGIAPAEAVNASSSSVTFRRFIIVL